MKKRLYILRHAKAVPGNDDVDDHARSLDAKGFAEAARMGKYLSQAPLKPQQIVCSTAERTRETLTALDLDTPVAFSDRLYLASAHELLVFLRSRTGNPERLMLITHNAGAHELVVLLAGEAKKESDFDRLQGDFPTCGLAVLSFIGDWETLSERSCVLEQLVFPTDL